MIGKSIFLWEEKESGKTTDEIVKSVVSAGFETVILHWQNVYKWEQKGRAELISALKLAGIKVAGCCAIYGDYPATEGTKAGELAKKYDLCAWIFDAESSFDSKSTPDSNASKTIKNFRSIAPSIPVGWCWWAFWHKPGKTTEWHPKKVLWAATCEAYGSADFGMPMVYWSWTPNTAENAVAYFAESMKQWREITNIPIIPAGRAYNGDGGAVTIAAMEAFEKAVRSADCPGISWWVMQQAVKLDGVWDSLSGMKKFLTKDEEQAPDPTTEPTFAHWYDDPKYKTNIDKLVELHNL